MLGEGISYSRSPAMHNAAFHNLGMDWTYEVLDTTTGAWTLLGDISVREGRLAVAGRYYARAHELNPRNPAVSQLASDPRAALR